MGNEAITRRRFLEGIGGSAAGAALGSGVAHAGSTVPAAAVTRSAGDRPQGKGPNVLVVMSDQHRADFMGCAGHPVLDTPAWDRLAREGVHFTNAYCSYPLCCPSRMSFLTGQLPSEIDCSDNVAQLASDIPTMAHGFSAAGYDTVLSGRMHIIGFDQRHGFAERILPDVPGTAFFNAGSWGGGILGPLRPATGASWQSLAQSGPGYQAFHDYDEEVVERTATWIQERARQPVEAQRPFFMVAGLILPHPPFVARRDDYEAVADGFSMDDLPDPQTSTLHPLHRGIRDHKQYDRDEVSPEDRLRTLRAYAANCRHTDRMMGRLLETLDTVGIAEDTVVVYLSDHGEQMGAHGLWGKNAFYEESMRVPLLMRWPAEIPGNRVVDEVVSLLDVGSTLLKLSGHDPLPRARSGGFASLLKPDATKSVPQDVLIEGVFGGNTPARTLRHGQWRYSCYDGQGEELYDLKNDPGEFLNLATEPRYRETVRELAQRARAGWAPAALRQRLGQRRSELAMIRAWTESSNMVEPDIPWHQGRTLTNYVDAL